MYRKIARKSKSAILRLMPRSTIIKKNIHTLPCTFSIDSPISSSVESDTFVIEGWIIPNQKVRLINLRGQFNGKTTDIKFGLQRPDVARAFPGDKRALNSGFSAELSTGSSNLVIEADFGDGYKEIYRIDIKFSPEKLVQDLINPDLSIRWAEHTNLTQNKKQYFYEAANEQTYIWDKEDARTIAFYLPQFHPIPENNEVWGNGFTEWTNVTTAVPRFVGHSQPILPKDTGFYDLRLEQNIADQITRAKRYGIYGFCFYYYWFSGRRLLETPLDTFIQHKEWDFNFTICWANENWTKRWDGRDSEVIVAQEYNNDDPLNFIKDVESIILDERYIREDGKPVLIVFRASELKQPEKYAETWRQYFRTKHKMELHLVSILSFDDKDPREYGFDAALDFAPQSTFFKNDIFPGGRFPYVDIKDRLIDLNFAGSVANYRSIALNSAASDYFKFPIYPCVTPSWDNDARKKGKGFVMYYENPDIYQRWLDDVMSKESYNKKSPLIFINAWNEWAEGAILEPTIHYGNAVLNRTQETLAKYSKHQKNHRIKLWGISRNETEIAVIIHLYYTDRWPEIVKALSSIKDKYDIFISLNVKDSKFSSKIKTTYPNAYIYIVPNRGRDVLPFMHIARRVVESGYQYILKLHSKKSLHRTDGEDWFMELLLSLLPDTDKTTNIKKTLNSSKTIIGPKNHFVSLEKNAHMGSNEEKIVEVLNRTKLKFKTDQIYKLGYFAGTMFWAHAKSLKPILDLFLMPEDFEPENGQIDGTTAHALERIFTIIPQVKSQPVFQITPEGKITEITPDDIISEYDFTK